MSAVIEFLDGGLETTVQDQGRYGLRHMGMAVCGALDWPLLKAANVLVGNDVGSAALEIRGLGPHLRVNSGTLYCAVAGTAILRNRTRQPQPASPNVLRTGRTIVLTTGDELQIGTIASGTAYLAFGGGLGLTPVLGSCSTFQRIRLGGWQGRRLQAGDQLTVPGTATGRVWYESFPFSRSTPTTLRVMTGPQWHRFTKSAQQKFFTTPFTVNTQSDRMGVRLKATTPLTYHDAKGADIISDGVTPGTIQVPANGEPIVLLADCQTVGGYAKIATVIEADVPLLGHLLPGQLTYFKQVSRAEADAARRFRQQEWHAWRQGVQSGSPEGEVDEEKLYSNNLISGLVNAYQDDL